MKFEQALRAMRRGEKVRRKCWTGPARYGIVKGQIVISPMGNRADPHHDEVLADDWVIVRKKPKARRFSEDELEPVGTEARVGDIIVAMEDKAYDIGPARRGDLFDYAGNGRIDSRRSFGSPELSNGWCFDRNEPSLRILKRPPPPLRDVFADPRVNDVVRHLGNWSKIHFDASREGRVWTIEEVTPRFVIIQTPDPVDSDMWTDAVCRSRPGWSKDGFAVISRAPEEVAPK